MLIGHVLVCRYDGGGWIVLVEGDSLGNVGTVICRLVRVLTIGGRNWVCDVTLLLVRLEIGMKVGILQEGLIPRLHDQLTRYSSASNIRVRLWHASVRHLVGIIVITTGVSVFLLRQSRNVGR